MSNSAPPPPDPWKISPKWIEHSDIRKEYREERASEMAADLKGAEISEVSAVSLAQIVIKSGFILNGGGVIAIPAVAALFNLDAEKMLPQLVLTALLFVGGLCSASIGSIFAFFALAHKGDFFYNSAVRTARFLEGKYFPPQAQKMVKQAEAAARRGARIRALWLTERYIAIILCLVSVALFIAGSLVGGRAILTAPHKLSSPVIQLPSPHPGLDSG
jgi:hypothetical protein